VCGLLGYREDAPIGLPAIEFPPYRSSLRSGDRQSATSSAAVPGGVIKLEYIERVVGDQVLITFRDVTEHLRRERQLAAFAQTTASIATAEALDTLLDTIAAQVLAATRIPACTLVLFSRTDRVIERVGTAGGYPNDYRERLEACRRLGAPLASLAAHDAHEPLIARDWCQQVLADPRWEPVHEVLRGKDWGALAAIPLTSQGTSIGGLTAFYPRGHNPAPSDVSFLMSIAELAAVAVQNHRMQADIERRSAFVERQRIARDLHDAVVQSLFSLVLQTEALEIVSAREGGVDRDERIRSSLADVRTLAKEALAEMRVLIHHLRPPALEVGGLAESIRTYADGLAVRHRVGIEVTGNVQPGSLELSVEEDVLRIVQESLNNAVRHSGAAHVAVAMLGDPDAGLVVTVTDDGSGFDPDGVFPGHWGLSSMRERAERIAAELRITSSSEGTCLSLVAPRCPGPGS
jgi:signal transduction histidine kinase